MPYITPLSAPPAGSCREISIPNDERMIAAVLGQILELTELENWEQTDGISESDTVAAWAAVFDSFAAQEPCNPEPGGDGDYTLIDDTTLESDTTTYTLSNLDSIDHEDLRVELITASSDGTQRDLRMRFNALSTSDYRCTVATFGNGTSYFRATYNYGRIGAQGQPSATPQRWWGYTQIDIPNFKDTDRYLAALFRGNESNHSLHGVNTYQVAITLTEINFFLSAADIKAGSRIKLYGRG